MSILRSHDTRLKITVLKALMKGGRGSSGQLRRISFFEVTGLKHTVTRLLLIRLIRGSDHKSKVLYLKYIGVYFTFSIPYDLQLETLISRLQRIFSTLRLKIFKEEMLHNCFGYFLYIYFTLTLIPFPSYGKSSFVLDSEGRTPIVILLELDNKINYGSVRNSSFQWFGLM